MSRPFRTSPVRGFFVLICAAVLVAFGLRAGTASADPDGPPADRKDQVAAVYAEAALLEVECAAARENLLESLKNLGKLRLGDNREALATLNNQLEQLKSMTAMTAPLTGKDTKALLDELQKSIAKDQHEYPMEVIDLIPKLFEEGDEGRKAVDALAKMELKLRVDAAGAEADRMRADFLEKSRSWYRKKQELAEVEVHPGE